MFKESLREFPHLTKREKLLIIRVSSRKTGRANTASLKKSTLLLARIHGGQEKANSQDENLASLTRNSNIKYFSGNNNSRRHGLPHVVTLNYLPISFLFLSLSLFLCFLLSLIEDRPRGKQSSSRARRGSTRPRNPEKYCKFESYRGG